MVHELFIEVKLGSLKRESKRNGTESEAVLIRYFDGCIDGSIRGVFTVEFKISVWRIRARPVSRHF